MLVATVLQPNTNDANLRFHYNANENKLLCSFIDFVDLQKSIKCTTIAFVFGDKLDGFEAIRLLFRTRILVNRFTENIQRSTLVFITQK